MRVIVVGAGAVGATVVESLHEHHECTVIDLDPARLKHVSDTFDVEVVRRDGAGRDALQAAVVAHAELVLACMPRDEANLVAAMSGPRATMPCFRPTVGLHWRSPATCANRRAAVGQVGI